MRYLYAGYLHLQLRLCPPGLQTSFLFSCQKLYMPVGMQTDIAASENSLASPRKVEREQTLCSSQSACTRVTRGPHSNADSGSTVSPDGCHVGTGHLGSLSRSRFRLLCFSNFNGQKNDLKTLLSAESGCRETSLSESGDPCKNVYSYVAHDDQTGNRPWAVEE